MHKREERLLWVKSSSSNNAYSLEQSALVKCASFIGLFKTPEQNRALAAKFMVPLMLPRSGLYSSMNSLYRMRPSELKCL
jgi:hypothetical protein